MYQRDEIDKWIKENLNADSKVSRELERKFIEDDLQSVMLNPSKMTLFMDSVNAVKKYCKNNYEPEAYRLYVNMFGITSTNCSIDIVFDRFDFQNYLQFFEMIRNASWMCLGLTKDNRVKFTIEFWGVCDAIM